MYRLFTFFSLVLLSIFLTGCGSGKVPFSGKIIFSDDGSPLTTGTIAFVKDGKLSRGEIKEDGTFVVGTDGVADGLFPGTYQVYISARKATPVESTGPYSDTGNYVYEELIDKKYQSPDTSGITVEVPHPTKHYELSVDRFKK